LRGVRGTAAAEREAALLHVSIDHFRATLRTYAGRTDAVLHQLATILRSATGGEGVVGELGWGEFGIIAGPRIRPGELAQFQALPVDIVKLDGAFMDNVVDDPTSREIVGWVCDLCRALDRRTVAEHCSTPDILETVRRLGIDYAQGHAVCEPFPLEQLLPHLPTLATLESDTIIEPLVPRQSPRNIR